MGSFELAKNHSLHPILLYLPLAELVTFVTNLISPCQLHHDFKTLIALIDALNIRCKLQPNLQEIIVSLQEQVIQEGIRYHQHCQHDGIINHLKEIALSIRPQTMQLDYRMNLSNECQPLSTLALHNARTFSTGPAIAPVVQSITVNLEYIYSAEIINALLIAALKTHDSVHVLLATPLTLKPHAFHVSILELLNPFLQTRTFNPSISQSLLLPLIVGKHWIGIKLVLLNNKIQSAVYFNSLEGPEPFNYRQLIITTLKQAGLLAATFRCFRNDQELKQQDIYACGPLLVENMVSDITMKYWPQRGTHTNYPKLLKTIRNRHLMSIKASNPQLYEIFAQQNNSLKLQDTTLQSTQINSLSLFKPANEISINQQPRQTLA